MLRKLLSVLLALCLCFFVSSTVLAAGVGMSDQSITADDQAKIIDALRYIEEDKENFDLGDVNFESIEVGESIYAYEYTDMGFDKIGEVCPLIADGQLIATTIRVGDNGYSIETSLAQAINKTDCKNIALVYDCDSCYLYDGLDFTLLGQSGIMVSERALLDRTKAAYYSNGLIAQNISNSVLLGYSSPSSALQLNTQTYFSCNVSYVIQLPFSNICWAATTATILNYLNGTSTTAAGINMEYFDSSAVVDEGVSPSSVKSFMQNNYNLSYTYNNYVPSASAILTNIVDGYPIYGSFHFTSNGGGYHACTIYGNNPISGYISVMDPQFGSTSAVSTGSSYSYVSAYAFNTLTLARAICHTW